MASDKEWREEAREVVGDYNPASYGLDSARGYLALLYYALAELDAKDAEIEKLQLELAVASNALAEEQDDRQESEAVIEKLRAQLAEQKERHKIHGIPKESLDYVHDTPECGGACHVDGDFIVAQKNCPKCSAPVEAWLYDTVFAAEVLKNAVKEQAEIAGILRDELTAMMAFAEKLKARDKMRSAAARKVAKWCRMVETMRIHWSDVALGRILLIRKITAQRDTLIDNWPCEPSCAGSLLSTSHCGSCDCNPKERAWKVLEE